jgi:hypothetical protein
MLVILGSLKKKIELDFYNEKVLQLKRFSVYNFLFTLSLQTNFP